MVVVDRSLLAYLKVYMVGLSFFMILLIVWSCLRLSWIIKPRSFALSFCSRIVSAMLSWMGCEFRG